MPATGRQDNFIGLREMHKKISIIYQCAFVKLDVGGYLRRLAYAFFQAGFFSFHRGNRKIFG